MMAMNIPNSTPRLTLQTAGETHGSVSTQSSGNSGSSFMSLLESLGSSPAKATDGNVSAESSSKKENAPVEKNEKSQTTDQAQPAKNVEPANKTVEAKEQRSVNEADTAEKKASVEKKSEDEKKSEKKSAVKETKTSDVQTVLASLTQKSNAVKQSDTSKEKTSGATKAVQKKTEDTVLAQNQLDFLKARDNSSDPDTLIANATEYSQKKSKRDLLKDAQNLSLEDPKKFLEQAQLAAENKTVAGMSQNGLKKVVANSEEKVGATKASAKKEAKFSERFSVVDERGSLSKELAAKAQKEKNTVPASEKGNSVDMTLSLAKNAEQNILSTNNQTAGATGSNFQSMLNQQIQQNVPEFVKSGSILLKDNSSGTINMVLKPESLGNVKVSLELTDKVITGQIVVQSQEAYDAMKENLDTLKQAFQQNGFDAANFNLSFQNNGSNGGFNQNQNQQQPTSEWLSNKVYGDLIPASGSVASSEETVAAYSGSGAYKIDYVA